MRHAVTRRSIVVQGRLDLRLSLERNGNALVERQDAPGDRSPFGDGWGRGLRRRRLREGTLGREREERKCERDNNKESFLHTGPEDITMVDMSWMTGGCLFS